MNDMMLALYKKWQEANIDADRLRDEMRIRRELLDDTVHKINVLEDMLEEEHEDWEIEVNRYLKDTSPDRLKEGV